MRIEELEMQIEEMEKGKGGRNHSYTSKVQYLSKNPVKNINISKVMKL